MRLGVVIHDHFPSRDIQQQHWKLVYLSHHLKLRSKTFLHNSKYLKGSNFPRILKMAV